MYNDQKTTKDRLSKTKNTSGVFGKQGSALKKKINCTCKGNKCTCK